MQENEFLNYLHSKGLLNEAAAFIGTRAVDNYADALTGDVLAKMKPDDLAALLRAMMRTMCETSFTAAATAFGVRKLAKDLEQSVQYHGQQNGPVAKSILEFAKTTAKRIEESTRVYDVTGAEIALLKKGLQKYVESNSAAVDKAGDGLTGADVISGLATLVGALRGAAGQKPEAERVHKPAKLAAHGKRKAKKARRKS